jgi:hypothetical protein
MLVANETTAKVFVFGDCVVDLEKLEKAIKNVDSDTLTVIEDAFINEHFEYFERYTLPAMVSNNYAPSYGWSADFRNKKEYEEFINELFNDENFFKKTLLEEFSKFYDPHDYNDRDEIKWYKKEYSKNWKKIMMEIDLECTPASRQVATRSILTAGQRN